MYGFTGVELVIHTVHKMMVQGGQHLLKSTISVLSNYTHQSSLLAQKYVPGQNPALANLLESLSIMVFIMVGINTNNMASHLYVPT